MLVASLVLFVIFLILGAPIWVGLIVAGGIANSFFLKIPGTALPQNIFSSIDSWVLLAVPFFLLAGNIMAKCGPAEALFNVTDKFVGHLRGGLPASVVIACVIFGAVTGSGVATVVAIGSIAVPEMLKLGYDKKFSMGLVVASGTLGLMIPPSVYMILFASLVQGDVVEYFTAGIVPGLLLAALLILVAIRGMGTPREFAASWTERSQALIKALPAIGMPVIVLGSIYSGIFTPTESSALATVYAIFISFIFYRNRVNLNVLASSLKSALASTASIFIILGGVTLFSTVLTYSHIPQTIVDVLVHRQGLSTLSIMGIIIAIYFLFGLVLDPVPIMYLTVPIMYPLVVETGINTTYFMIITITCMMIAQITPPFGMALFALSGHFKERVEIIVQGMLPFLMALVVGVVILLLFPQISLILPQLLLQR